MDLKRQIEVDGIAIIPSVFDSAWISERIMEVEAALANHANNEGVRERGGVVYAARNVLELIPGWLSCWRTSQIQMLLSDVLGSEVALVRGLFFDKPPEQTWALPWHKDLSIAITECEQIPAEYSTPRLKAGVWHSEPPVEVLESMLTLRIHLDDVTKDNGPLEVLPGSHKTGKDLQIERFQPETILLKSGDVLAMRPLLAHASGTSSVGSQQHRRVIHLEFAGTRELPGGVNWHHFWQND